MAKSFEQKLNSPFYKYSKRVVDLVALNIIFILMSALSLMVLFFPGLVALHTVIFNMVHEKDIPPYKTFFLEIKEEWSFCWRLEVLGMSVLLITGTLIYFDLVYIRATEYNLIAWFSLVFVISVFIILFIVYENLIVFNNYFKDDTFKMMIKKSALISLKRKWMSVLNLIIFIVFGVTLFIFPYIIPFISFTAYIYIVETLSRKRFTEIAVEENERALMAENLFLPMVIEEQDSK
ncbi:MAG: hypothetical protein IJ186_03325 [Bacilli bacterium]|nr:hypothetical protein [Bacilli bacterium]